MTVSRFTPLLLGLALGLGLVVVQPAGPALAGTTQAKSAVQVLFERGRKAMEAHDYKTAVTEFERALVADPTGGHTYTLLAVSHARLGNDGKAKKYFRSALDIDPNDLDALQYQGQLYASAGDLTKAQENADKLAKACGECAQQKGLVAEIARARANPPKTQADGGPGQKAPTQPGG